MTAAKGRYKFEGKLPYSSYLKISWAKDDTVKIVVEKPYENMQTDAADFEAVALMCRCLFPECAKVEIDFQRLEWHGRFGEQDTQTGHYLRFLYRLDMFARAFDWVEISESAEIERKRFADLLKNAEPSNNIPDAEARKNPSVEERKVEAALVSDAGRAYLNELYMKDCGGQLSCLYPQLPCGLFNCGASGTPEEKNRILTSGYYDIWGLDDKNNLCVFELKKDNGYKKLGVISELFFYAVYAKDILLDHTRLHQQSAGQNYRGYDVLCEEVVTKASVKSVRAFFLLGKDVHPLIKEKKEELLALLNNNSFGIHFGVIRYDYNRVKEISLNNLR